MIETFAGTGRRGFNGDLVSAAQAQLDTPEGLAADSSGNLYIADRYNHRIRRVDANGVITTIAGTGRRGRTGDGSPAAEACLDGPTSLAADGRGNLFVAEFYSHRIRRIDRAGVITSFAGTGEEGSHGDGGEAARAQLSGPSGLATDAAGNVYVAENGTHRVRRIDRSGTITTVAGNGEFGCSGDGGPATRARLMRPNGIAADRVGNLFVSDYQRIRRIDPNGTITTVAGIGTDGFAGDGGPAVHARLSRPRHLAVDTEGNLFVADQGNRRIRRIDRDGVITTVAGPGRPGLRWFGRLGPEAYLSDPHGLSLVGNRSLFIADPGDHRIRVLRIDRQVSVVLGAGRGSVEFLRTPQGALWRGGMRHAMGSEFRADDGRTYVLRSRPDGSLTWSHPRRTQSVRLPNGQVLVVERSEDGRWHIGRDEVANGHRHADGGNEYFLEFVSGRWRLAQFMIRTALDRPTVPEGIPAVEADLVYPTDVALDPVGNVYVADEGDGLVRRIGCDGTISTVAGTGNRSSRSTEGSARGVRLLHPRRLATDAAGNLYVSQIGPGSVLRIEPAGRVSQVAVKRPGQRDPDTRAMPLAVGHLATDAAGRLYLADSRSNFVCRIDRNGSIRELAGIGRPGFGGDGGPATEAALDGPSGLAVSGEGTVYVADRSNGRVRRIDDDGTIETVAGSRDRLHTGDGGPAAEAYLAQPGGVAVDSEGCVYVSDTPSERVRKIDASGVITRFAGTGDHGFAGDGGPAAESQMHWPEEVVADSAGNVYIADTWNCRVRRVDPSGRIVTVAGTGKHGYSGDGGPAAEASLNVPKGLALNPKGNLYVADSKNNRIRMIDASGTITTIAGTGRSGFTGDGGPAVEARLRYPCGVAVDAAGNVYFGDSSNNRVRMIDSTGVICTIAGTGRRGFRGDGGPAAEAALNWPDSLAMDAQGGLLVADHYNNRIRRIDRSGLIRTVAGTGKRAFGGDGGPAERAHLNRPSGLAVDRSGNVYIADHGNGRVRCVDTSGIITTFAGGGDPYHNGDGGPALRANFGIIQGLALGPGGGVYIADSRRHCIRKFEPGGRISTVAGTGEPGYTGDGGAATEAGLRSPEGVATDSEGNIYVADSGNRRVRRIDPTGTITTFAGSGRRSECWKGGPRSETTLWDFRAMAADAFGRLCFAVGGRVWRLESSGTVSLVAGESVRSRSIDADEDATAEPITGLAADGAGNLYLAEPHRVLRIAPGGAVTTFAGTGERGRGHLEKPSGWDGGVRPLSVAADDSGNVYFVDTVRERIRRVDPTGGIDTVAGIGLRGDPGDGAPARVASFNKPADVAADRARNLYVADRGHHRIRKIDPQGIVSTIAGTGEDGFSGDGGPASAAMLSLPTGVACDPADNIYVCDFGNRRVRKIDCAGNISTIAGTGEEGSSGDGGPACRATFREPIGVAADGTGNVFVSDVADQCVRRIDASGIIRTVADTGRPAHGGDAERQGVRATLPRSCFPEGVAADDAGNVYVADCAGNRLLVVRPAGSVEILAGTGEAGFSGDGDPARDALLDHPSDVAVDPSGKLYIADNGNSRIRKIDSAGVISTIYGLLPPPGYAGDGSRATEARFVGPLDVAADGKDNVYVADAGDHRVRRIDGRGTIHAFAGNGKRISHGPGGPALKTSLDRPSGIAASPEGDVYIADSAMHRIYRIGPDGELVTIAGTGEDGCTGDGGPATQARVSPADVTLDREGSLYVAADSRVRRIDARGIVTTVAGTGDRAYGGDGGPACAAGLTAFRIASGRCGEIWISGAAKHGVRVLRRYEHP